MVNAQTYLDQNYPQEERGSVTILEVRNKILEGNLDLRDFLNLTQLSFDNGKLNSIDLSKNTKLETIEIFQNRLSADLSIFSHLVNLKYLDLGLDNEMFKDFPDFNNNFSGSLKSLENCKNLKWICIGHQSNIAEGLEYLPAEKLTYFGCHGTVFAPILQPYDYDVYAWQLVNVSTKANYENLLSKIESARLKLAETDLKIGKKNRLQSKLEKLMTKFSQLDKEQLQETKKNLTDLSNSLGEKRKLIVDLENKKKHIEELKSTYSIQQKSDKKLIEDFRKANKDFSAANENLRSELTKKTKLLQDYTEANEKNFSAAKERKNEISKLKSELEAKKIDFDNLTEQKNNWQKQFEKERSDFLSLDRDYNKFKNKINKKLESGGLFTANKQGKTLEEAIDNLLEKQTFLEVEIKNNKSLPKSTQDLKTEFSELNKKRKARIDKLANRRQMVFNSESKDIDEALDRLHTVTIEDEKHLPGRAKKICDAVGATWLSNKIGTGLTIAGLATVLPLIFTGLGYLLKSYLKVKTGGVAGAYSVANGMINHGGGNNIPPPYQPLPPPQNPYLPPYQPPQPLPEPTLNLPPVINNHYHTLPVEKKTATRKVQKKKTN